MKINGIDVRKYGARQHHVEIGHQSMKFSNEWNAGSVLPYMGICRAGFKTLAVKLVMKGKTREAIIRNRSELLGLFTKPATIELKGNPHHFYGVLKSHKETEINQRTWHNMELSIDCYEYGDDITESGARSIEVNNPGSAVSPCLVTITPTVSAEEIILTGICINPVTGEDVPVIITDITERCVIRLDGISGLITQTNAAGTRTELKEIDMWELPALNPGVTTVECNNSLMAVDVTVRPVYM